MKKNILKLTVLLLIIVAVVSIISNSCVYATLGYGFDRNLVTGNAVDENIETAGNNVGATVILVFQVLAATGVIFAGIRYMFSATSKNKADIKMGLLGVAVGCIIIFGGPTFINFIVRIFRDFVQ